MSVLDRLSNLLPAGPTPATSDEELERLALQDAPLPTPALSGPGRHAKFTGMAQAMHRVGFPVAAILDALTTLDTEYPGEPLAAGAARAIALKVEAETIVRDRDVSWPVLPPQALHGLAGEVVRFLEPISEADTAGLLGHFLVYFGNYVGAAAHYRILSAWHPAKLFAVFVGRSNYGKKGSAHDAVQLIFEAVDDGWLRKCVQWGSVSGESLVRHFEAVAGEHFEPRLMLRNTEFANFLKAAAREGSTLGGTTCEAWDGDRLKLMRSTKKNSLTVEGTHISMVGHITPPDLISNLGPNSSTNGFLNRFLWFLVRQSKDVPIPKLPPIEHMRPIVNKVIAAATFAQEKAGQMTFDPEAEAYWISIYGDMGRERPGMAGLATSRPRPQILRLALVYALLDSSERIRRQHIEAAQALFEFNIDCAQRIFGDRMANALAQRIFDLLLDAENGELSRDEIYNAVGKNYSGPQLDEAFRFLELNEYIHKVDRPRPPGTRGPRPEIYAVTPGSRKRPQ